MLILLKKEGAGHTLADALNDMVHVPKRPIESPVRVPTSGCFKIKGVGDIVTGRSVRGS